MKAKADLNKDERYFCRDIREWNDYCSMFYNGLLDIKMQSTRVFSQEDLEKLGLQDWIVAMSETLELGP